MKRYIEGGIYHVYNRGALKQDIFLDDLDFRVFLALLKYYLSPPPVNLNLNTVHPFQSIAGVDVVRPRLLANIFEEINLLCFCLMPNHFHLIIKQITLNGMQKLMRRLSTAYAMYFNKRYERSGYVFQGVYKAVLVDTDEYLLHLSRYIHLNPSELTGTVPVSEYLYSSYAYYLGRKSAVWLKPELILEYFLPAKRTLNYSKYASYQSFVDDYKNDSEKILGELVLDDR